MTDSAPALVRRGRRNARYTAISNDIIDHPILSPEARIVLIYLLSKPDNWELKVNDIRRLLGTAGKPCGRNKAYEVIKELKASAYVVAVHAFAENGRFDRIAYYVFDEPHPDPEGFKAEHRSGAVGDESRPAGDVVRAPISPRPEIREAVASPRPQIRYPEKRDLTKDRKKQTTEIPPPSPKPPVAAGTREGGGFSEFWTDWPEANRPRERPLAAKLFAGLSPAGRQQAAQFAPAYRATQGQAGGFAPMLPYLRQRLFTEFDGAPEIDGGHFVLTPDRPEWPAWRAHLEAHHSPSVVERQAAKGQFLTPTRWPPKPADTTSSISPSDKRSHLNDRASTGAGQ